MLSFQGEDENFALVRFEKMLKTNDTYFFDSTDFERIISHYLNDGKITLAEKAVDLALNQHPAALALQLFKVEILILKEQTKEALQLLNTVSAIEKTNEDVYILKASIYSKEGNHQKAITTLKKALLFTDDLFEINNLLAMEQLFLDNYDKALQHFQICLTHNPEDANTLYNIVYCYEMQEREKELIPYLNNFIDKNPYNELAWHLLGKQYFEQKKYKKALRAFDYATLIDEQFIGALIEKAKTYEKLKNFKQAAACYHITLKLDDATAFVYLRLGICYQELKRNDLATFYYNEAIKEDPNLIKAWVAIITFYMERDALAKALHYTKKAINANETSPILWKIAAVINAESQQYEESELAYDQCLDLGNYEKNTYLNYVDVLLTLGKKEKAISILLQAKEYYEDALILYLLAAFCYDLDKAEANLYLLAALEADKTIYKEIASQFNSLESKKAKRVYKAFMAGEEL